MKTPAERDDALRETLFEMLDFYFAGGYDVLYSATDALLPVVREYGDQRAVLDGADTTALARVKADAWDEGAYAARKYKGILLNPYRADAQTSEEDDNGPDFDGVIDAPPCAVCGSNSACGYDAEGRVLIHADWPEEQG